MSPAETNDDVGVIASPGDRYAELIQPSSDLRDVERLPGSSEDIDDGSLKFEDLAVSR